MPFSADAMKPPLHDQITEMQRKIQLLEGDRTAYYESSQSTIKKNRDTIRQLRQENKRLCRKLAEVNSGDENIIKVAFHNRGLEKDAYRNMSGKAALSTLDQRVLSKMKRLNALKHTTQTHQRRLEELKMGYQRMKPEGSSGAPSADARARKKEEDAMKLRALENSLEKTQFKCKEAENIMTNYQKLKSHLEEESLTFHGQLDSLEAEILKHRVELHNMQVMNNNAQLSKDAAKVELQQQEELLYKERKERERIIASYRKKVDERKAQAEKVDRRAQRTTMQPDELSSEAQRSTPRMTGEEEKAISSFEEAFRRIKEATGVTDIQEIVERFISQRETHQHLEKLREENEKVLQQLKEQKELLNQQFQDMKYSGEAKLSSDQQMLEECEQQLQAQQQKCDAGKERLEWLVKALGTVRAGVEHLADKLQHITLSEDTVADVSPDSDEFVVELMTQCELKLQLLHEELHGKDLAAIMKEMEEEEFYVRIEGKLPAYNTRVKLPDDQRLDLFNDEDDSEEDEADIISREALKRQSLMIIDSNNKKKPWKKKKGKF
ncbi:coiled-coil domain-containing protein 151 isoform X1 [Sander lucioperca]|uniref:Outer dynein arm docking complex subunit 3 n=1 Tax=Sander lucioperca TaxID=283035 RepID=A0A8C9YH50_SANLU|nr:coiled-coil domain-containing protein 151 isoform X1 [Sander lucioperca]XP_035856644.1 coiled-coil domain-containing protein 151 isoform X1 [Sander lucioperca]